MSRSKDAASWLHDHPSASLQDAGNQFGVSREAVRLGWRELYGAELTPLDRSRADLDAAVAAFIAEHGPTPRIEIARTIGASISKIVTVWKRLGLPPEDGLVGRIYNESDIEYIRRLAADGKSGASISKATGLRYRTIRKICRDHGISTHGTPTPGKLCQQASAMMDRDGCSVPTAAHAYGIAPPSLAKYRKDRGLTTRISRRVVDVA